ncbi:MAG: hypothetical protein WAN48_01910 [Actinomycetes bacterium]
MSQIAEPEVAAGRVRTRRSWVVIAAVVAGVLIVALAETRPWLWDDYVAGYHAGEGANAGGVRGDVCSTGAKERFGYAFGSPGPALTEAYWSYIKGCRDRAGDQGFNLTRTFVFEFGTSGD